MRKALIALSSAALVAACGYIADKNGLIEMAGDSPQIEAAKQATITASKDLAVDLCPLGVEYIGSVAETAGPILAAIVKGATASACATLNAKFGVATPASVREGVPQYCQLEPVQAGSMVALANGTSHTITAAEAAAFNADLQERCAP